MKLPGKIASLFHKKDNPAANGLDGFPLYADTPDADMHAQINAYLEQAEPDAQQWAVDHITQLSGKLPILKASPQVQVRMALALARRMAWFYQQRHQALSPARWRDHRINSAFDALFNRLLRRSLPFSQQDWVEIIRSILAAPPQDSWHFQIPTLLNAIQRTVSDDRLAPALRESLELFRQQQEAAPAGRANTSKIENLLGRLPSDFVTPGEPWTNLLLAYVQAMAPEAFAHWSQLLIHLTTASGGTPSARWFKDLSKWVESAGREEFSRYALRWLEAATHPGEWIGDERSTTVLKGLVWASSSLEPGSVRRLLGDLGVVSYQKLPEHGPRSKKVGNACVYVLSVLPDKAGISELARIQRKAHYADAQSWIAQALERAAQNAGLPVADLEDLSVPGFDLDLDGNRRERIGEYVAVLTLEGVQSARLAWLNPQGKSQKSPPACIKDQHAEELANIKRTQKDIQDTLIAQRDRLERAMITQRTWSYADWNERYLQHPLLLRLASRLVWYLKEGERSDLGCLQGVRLVDRFGAPLEWITPTTQVLLWHPLGFPARTVQDWRTWLEEREITQPFKQAHRELYVLTDAELDSFTYSNRFAAHILKQHQLNALCRQRGWVAGLQGGWDVSPAPRLRLPDHGLEAIFMVEGVHGEGQIADTGVCLYVATDQVQFRTTQNRPIPLTEVPALVFSEVMRDVDLFVGVCSVGNDPDWQDGGRYPAYQEYWNSYAFGQLNTTAQTRQEVLTRLLPRLKIAPQCKLQDRFLVVHGKLRTYKIHLGSGNILMAPNDQYLCIVPDQARVNPHADKVFLPFDGDHLLSVILSKAFLLAADDQIKDRSILKQIQHSFHSS